MGKLYNFLFILAKQHKSYGKHDFRYGKPNPSNDLSVYLSINPSMHPSIYLFVFFLFNSYLSFDREKLLKIFFYSFDITQVTGGVLSILGSVSDPYHFDADPDPLPG